MNILELSSARLDNDLKKQAIRLGYLLYRYGGKDCYEYAQTATEIKEAIEKNKRTRNAMRNLDRQINLADDLTRARGVCPHCHMVLPFSGVCDCGYIKPEPTDVASVYEKYARKKKDGKPYASKKPKALVITNKYARLLARLH